LKKRQTTYLIIILISFLSYQLFKEIQIRTKDISEYELLNSELLKTNKKYGFINSVTEITEPKTKEYFQKLNFNNKLIYVDFYKNGNIFYKIKDEKVKSIFNLGAQRYSYYLVYSKNEKNDFEKLFKDDFELEESIEKSRKIEKNWFYVIGVSYID